MDLPGTGSPPSKKPRRSPVENHAYPHPPPGSMSQPSNSMAPPGGPGGPGPGQGPSPGQQSMVGMRPMTSGGAPMNGFPPTGGQVHMGGPPPMGNNGPPHPMNPMSPPMGGMHGQPGMMTPQMVSWFHLLFIPPFSAQLIFVVDESTSTTRCTCTLQKLASHIPSWSTPKHGWISFPLSFGPFFRCSRWTKPITTVPWRSRRPQQSHA